MSTSHTSVREHTVERLRFMPQLPFSGTRNLAGSHRTPRFLASSTIGPGGGANAIEPLTVVVAAPVPSAGLKALECNGPATSHFQRPVDAGTTVTVTVKCRQNALVVQSGTLQLSRPGVDWKAYLEIERSDGTTAKASMTSAVDSWVTLSAELAIAEIGVLLIRLCSGHGVIGDNLYSVALATRPNVPGPKVWFSDLQVSVA